MHTSFRIPNLSIPIRDRNLEGEAFILDMIDFDVILGMDWLDKHHALLDCHRKKVIFQYPREKEFVYQCPRHMLGRFIISALRVVKLVKDGCSAFLASVIVA